MNEKLDPMFTRVAERFAFDTFAMSNLRPSDTGVEGTVIWVSAGEFGGADAQHGPRIKVYVGTRITTESLQNAVSVRLTDPPVFLGKLPGKTKKLVTRFVTLNLETLLRYWSGELSTKEMLDLIVKAH